MDLWRYIEGLPPFLRHRAFVVGTLVLCSLLSCATGGRAQQRQRSQVLGSSIPTLEALPHSPMPRGDLIGWCGWGGKILLRVGNGIEVYDGGMKASPLTFPIRSRLQCDEGGQKLVFIDDEAGSVSEVDIPGGIVTRTIATYDKAHIQSISFSPI